MSEQPVNPHIPQPRDGETAENEVIKKWNEGKEDDGTDDDYL